MDGIWITDGDNKGSDNDNRNAAAFIAILIAAMIWLCMFAPNAYAVVRPGNPLQGDIRTTMEYYASFTGPNVTRSGVTYRLDPVTHYALITKVSGKTSKVPIRFKYKGGWYYPECIKVGAIRKSVKTLVLHARVRPDDSRFHSGKVLVKTCDKGYYKRYAKYNDKVRIKYYRHRKCVALREDMHLAAIWALY